MEDMGWNVQTSFFCCNGPCGSTQYGQHCAQHAASPVAHARHVRVADCLHEGTDDTGQRASVFDGVEQSTATASHAKEESCPVLDSRIFMSPSLSESVQIRHGNVHLGNVVPLWGLVADHPVVQHDQVVSSVLHLPTLREGGNSAAVV